MVKGVLRRRQAYIVAFLLLILVGAGALAAAPLDAVPSLFDPPTVSYQGARSAQPAARRVVMRWRPAAVRPDVLTRADGSPQVGVGQRIRLELFADASFTVTITDLVRHGPTGYTWSGALDGIDFGSAILAVHDGATVGTVVMPGAVYRIGYAPDGTQVIEQLDESALPPEGEPVAPPPLAEHDSLTAGVAADTGSQIDVMVVYTAAARAAAGGTAAMQAEVTAAVASANLAYTNNGLVQRLRLVYAGEGSITETGDFSADLGTLKNDATVASLRNAHGADLVSLFTDNGAVATFCGIGYLMTSNSTSFAPYGFSVVERHCASANLTFAHELGHNMGAHHDPYVTGSDPGLFAYSHGYVDTVAPFPFRTVMAYNNQCVDSGFNCTRITYFSSPNQTVGGRVIGNALVSDNARTLAQSANTVANFRQAVVGGSTSTFADVPADDPFSSWVEALVAAGITSGCSTNPPLFCPTQVVTRGQMAVFLLKGIAYPGVAVPSPPSGTVFADVPASNPFAKWIEALYAASITGGCATNPLRYCPDGAVTRAQMAVLLLRAKHGSGYTPAAPTLQTFADVPLGHPFASWIYQLAAEGITGGCATNPNRYCPDNQVTRAQMAVFLVRTFNLPQ